MDLRVDSLAWLDVAEEPADLIYQLKKQLTIASISNRKAEVFYCFQENDGVLGIPRAFFNHSDGVHSVDASVCNGDEWPERAALDSSEAWTANRSDDPRSLTMADKVSGEPAINTLSPGQKNTLDFIVEHFSRQYADGIISFGSAQESTKICALAIGTLRVKTLILCPSESHVSKWKTVINRYVPDCVVSINSDTGGTSHVVLAVLDDFSGDTSEFGFVISDQLQFLNPKKWHQLISSTSAAKRLGISDSVSNFGEGINRIYSYHLGQRLACVRADTSFPRIKRVWSAWDIAKGGRVNPQFLSKRVVVDMMCTSSSYNETIVEQVFNALRKGRRIAIFSDRLSHLKNLKLSIQSGWSESVISTDYILDGMSFSNMDVATEANVIFATYDLAPRMADATQIDTVFLATPTKNPEDAISVCTGVRPGKKRPVVVDMRCDSIPVCREYAKYRDAIYETLYEASPDDE